MSWISWAGEVFRAILIGILVLMAPRLGTATNLALIAGQMLCSLAFDHVRVLGLAPQPISPVWLAGAAYVSVSVTLFQAR